MPPSQSAPTDLDRRDHGPAEDAPFAPGSRPVSPAAAEKAPRIADACASQDVDALIHLATTGGGLVDDSLRRTACTHTGAQSPHDPILILHRRRAYPTGVEE